MEVRRSDTEIARVLGVPRSLCGWRHGRGSRYHRLLHCANPSWRPTHPRTCCYLLGAYLGDGCIVVNRRGAASLAIVLDSTHPAIIEEIRTAMKLTLSSTPVPSFPHRGRATILKANHPALPFAFPQHGAGRKHKRRIELTDWQLELTERHPRELLRGLIHSDGWRTINRFKTKLPSGRTCRPTSAASSAITATCSGFAGPTRIRATSRFLIARALPCSTSCGTQVLAAEAPHQASPSSVLLSPGTTPRSLSHSSKSGSVSLGPASVLMMSARSRRPSSAPRTLFGFSPTAAA